MTLRQFFGRIHLCIKRAKYKKEVRQIPSKRQSDLAEVIRQKDKIKVAFILYDIAKWRTEELYLQMLNHPRFDPVLVLVLTYSGNYAAMADTFIRCAKFLDDKGYPYVVGEKNKSIDELVKPDIVFYGEHYGGTFDSGYSYQMGTVRNSLSCYVPYSMHNTINPETNNQVQSNLVWMAFVENQTCKDDLSCIVDNKARNKVVTGIPIQDDFLRADGFTDKWKPQTNRKKRIIWAPSHTISVDGITNAFNQSTFLEIADDMLVLAKKYQDSVQWAFKPHPVLKRKLILAWGKERTEKYYAQWRDLEYSQLEEGQYIDLFMTSDAMIHDCMSFMVEYMFTEKPIIFLDNGKAPRSLFNTQTKNALDLHYKGVTIDDIEKFIQTVVMNGEDPLKLKRVEFKRKYLVPPHGKTAVQNMINALLGTEEYRNIEFY